MINIPLKIRMYMNSCLFEITSKKHSKIANDKNTKKLKIPKADLFHTWSGKKIDNKIQKVLLLKFIINIKIVVE